MAYECEYECGYKMNKQTNDGTDSHNTQHEHMHVFISKDPKYHTHTQSAHTSAEELRKESGQLRQ